MIPEILVIFYDGKWIRPRTHSRGLRVVTLEYDDGDFFGIDEDSFVDAIPIHKLYIDGEHVGDYRGCRRWIDGKIRTLRKPRAFETFSQWGRGRFMSRQFRFKVIALENKCGEFYRPTFGDRYATWDETAERVLHDRADAWNQLATL